MKRPLLPLIAVISTLLALAVAAPIVAQDDDDPASKHVSLELDNQSLVDSLKILFKSVGANYVLEPSITRGATNARVNLSIANQPFLQALESVLTAGSARGLGLTYRLENGIYTITAKDGSPAVSNPPVIQRPVRVAGVAKSRVTLALQEKGFDEALRMLFEAGNVQFVMPLRVPSTGTVTMSMTNMPLEGALLGVLKAVELGNPLGWQEVTKGLYAIVPLPGSRPANPESARISLNLNQTGLRDALSAVFRASGANFTIDQAVQSAPVTLKLHDVTLKNAAEMLLRSSGHAEYMLAHEIGVYRVGVKAR